MSASHPDVRVWISATGGPSADFDPSTFHDSRSCANRGGGEPIPSFVGFCTDLEPCGSCARVFLSADPEPASIDWDDLKPAIRRINYECEHCGKTFERERAHRGHKGQCPAARDSCEACEQATDQLAYVVHRLEDHGIPQSRLDLEPGDFEAAAEQADTVPELSERTGFSIQKTVRLCRLYDIEVGPDTEAPDGDDRWEAYYERTQAEIDGESA